MRRLILITILVIGGVFLAQGVLALTISPPVFELGANTGDSPRQSIKLFNETATEITVYTSTADFTAKAGEEGEPAFFAPGEKEGDLADWIEIEKGPITVLPLAWEEIPFTINVPTWADPGGHYAAVFFGTQPPEVEEGIAIGLAGKIGSLVLLRVSGEIEETGRLLEFSLKDEKKFYEYLPVDFLIRFENLGNVHLKPQGEILIKNIFGGTAGEVDVNKPEMGKGGNVLPGTIRLFESSWVKNPFETPPQGFFEKLKIEKNNFAFGRYKGDLDLGYGTQGKRAQAILIFWVFPWHLILVLVFGIALLIFLLIVGIKKYNQWVIRKATQGIVRKETQRKRVSREKNQAKDIPSDSL